MADEGGGGILDRIVRQMVEEERKAQAGGDSPLKLTSTGKDGTVYEVEGIPQSQAAKWLKDHFGIGSDDDSEGQGDEGGGQQGDSPLRTFFKGGQQGKQAS